MDAVCSSGFWVGMDLAAEEDRAAEWSRHIGD